MIYWEQNFEGNQKEDVEKVIDYLNWIKSKLSHPSVDDKGLEEAIWHFDQETKEKVDGYINLIKKAEKWKEKQ